MRYFFWICWSIEFIVVLWLLFEDLNTPLMPITPAVYLGFIWLAAALFVRFVLNGPGMSNIMVGLPAALMVVYGGFILLAVGLGGRWN